MATDSNDLRSELQQQIDRVLSTAQLFRKIEADNACLRQQVDDLRAELEKAKATQPTVARHAGNRDVGSLAPNVANDALYLWAAVAMRQPNGCSHPPALCNTVWESLRGGAPPFNRNDWEYPDRLQLWAAAVTSVLAVANNKAFFQATVTHVRGSHGGTTNLRLFPRHDSSNNVYLLSFRGNSRDNLTWVSASWNFTNLAADLIPGDLERFLLTL